MRTTAISPAGRSSAPRSTGSPDAARMLRRISSSGDRRRPSATSRVPTRRRRRRRRRSARPARAWDRTAASPPGRGGTGTSRRASATRWTSSYPVDGATPAGLARQRREDINAGCACTRDAARASSAGRSASGARSTVSRARGRPDGRRAPGTTPRGDCSTSTGASATAARPARLNGSSQRPRWRRLASPLRGRPSENAVTGTAPAAAPTADTAATAWSRSAGEPDNPNLAGAALPARPHRPAALRRAATSATRTKVTCAPCRRRRSSSAAMPEAEQVARVEQRRLVGACTAARRQAGAPAAVQWKSS